MFGLLFALGRARYGPHEHVDHASGGKRAGFQYLRPTGARSATAKRSSGSSALRNPPAWRDVHVAASPRTAIQAWGFDARGRKQYRYHEAPWRRASRASTIACVGSPATSRAFARRSTRRSPSAELTRDRVAAAVVRLISKGFFRMGSERYARENKSFGISSLLKRHVTVKGYTTLF